MKNTIIAFDLNKTLIKENSWYNLNLAMGITEQEDELLYRLGPEDEAILTYEEWIDILTRLMVKRGRATQTAINKSILNFSYLPGAKEAVEDLKKRGFITGLITGALSPIAEKVAKELQMDFVYCNAEVIFDSSKKLSRIDLQNNDVKFKVDMVQKLKSDYPEAKTIYYVADGDNDEGIFEVTKGILLDPKNVEHESWKNQAVEEGSEFSLTKSQRKAWKIAASIGDVPSMIE